MAQAVNCLLIRYEDLSLISHIHIRETNKNNNNKTVINKTKLAKGACLCNPSTGNVETGRPRKFVYGAVQPSSTSEFQVQ